MNRNVKSVGIIGLGSFGQFVAGILFKNTGLNILGVDAKKQGNIPGVNQTSLKDVAAADVLVLAIPLSSYRDVLSEIKPLVKPESLVIDVCSVKMLPGQLIDELLPSHPNILLTHPLFGPQSAGQTTKGHQLVVTSSKGLKAEKVLTFAKERLGLEIDKMAAADHDKAMAKVHALTFFVARGLNDMHLGKTTLTTPSFQMVEELVSFDKAHSQELFDTIEQGNPFANAAREDLLASLNKVQANILSGNHEHQKELES